MAELPEDGVRYAVTCPHCKRDFEAEVMSGPAERYQGFKCPHCRLFVSYERADTDEAEANPA
jgi:transposase-like protein